ncbi:MAG: T9SS type A sorting domain-containing protein [Saprospiraceae bacterium]|nr:T9SS type A sorting domain-containing protein [Saprospiraceae bacterium]
MRNIYLLTKLCIFLPLFLVLGMIAFDNSSENMPMSCVDATWNSVSKCIEVSNLPASCAPIISSVREWTDGFNGYKPLPASGTLCNCDVSEFLEVTPVCNIVGNQFYLGGQNFNKCPGRCLSRTDFTFPQGSSNIADYPVCAQNINCITITPQQFLLNGASMTAYYRSDTEFGSVVTIIRFTYNGQGLNCNNITSQIIQQGRIYKNISIRRTVTCSGGAQQVCETTVNIPQVPDPCLLEGFINTLNVGSPCNYSGYGASTINLATPATYQWTYNNVNISENYYPSIYCLSGRPSGIYCVKVLDANGCMTEPCRIYQASCNVSTTVAQSGFTINATVVNCPSWPSYQWSRWSGSSWVNVGTNQTSYNTAGLAGEYRVLVTCGSCMAFGNIIVTQQLPLPVVLSGFYAESDACGPIKLMWETKTEQNSKEFVIEKSIDGKSFETIGSLPCKNLTTSQHYIFEDKGLLENDKTYFYRLRQIDFDGKETIYQVIAQRYICVEKTDGVSIYPNPSTNYINISGLDPDIKSLIEIKSVEGKTLLSKIVDPADEITIHVESLSPGLYSLHYVNSSQNSSINFIKL